MLASWLTQPLAPPPLAPSSMKHPRHDLHTAAVSVPFARSLFFRRWMCVESFLLTMAPPGLLMASSSGSTACMLGATKSGLEYDWLRKFWALPPMALLSFGARGFASAHLSTLTATPPLSA